MFKLTMIAELLDWVVKVNGCLPLCCVVARGGGGDPLVLISLHLIEKLSDMFANVILACLTLWLLNHSVRNIQTKGQCFQSHPCF